MLMNDLDLIYDNEEKKRNTALNLIDDCIFFGWNSCTYLLHTLLFCMANATKKKNEASFELIFQNCFINIEQYSGISYHYDKL